MPGFERRTEHTTIEKGGTPNDVTKFPVYDERSSLAPIKSPSRSIPIAHTQRSVLEMQQDEEEALAEYRDYVMYQRIANSKQSRSVVRPSLNMVPAVYPNSLQSFVMLANNPSHSSDGTQGASYYQYGSTMMLVPPVQSGDESSSQEGIFDLEL